MFDFPDAPVLDQTVSSPDGTTYYWDGTKWTLAVSGASLTGWSVTETGAVPGAYTIVDTISGVERLIIEPAGTPIVGIIIDDRGAISTDSGALVFKTIMPAGDAWVFRRGIEDVVSISAGGAVNTGVLTAINMTVIDELNAFRIDFGANGGVRPVLTAYGTPGSEAVNLWGPGPDFPKNIVITGINHTVAPATVHYKAATHWFGPWDDSIDLVRPERQFGWWDADGIAISGQPDLDVAGTFKDATLRLTANTQSWDLIGATPDSGSAPGAFIIADATTGERRLLIEPGSGATIFKTTRTSGLPDAWEFQDATGAVIAGIDHLGIMTASSFRTSGELRGYALRMNSPTFYLSDGYLISGGVGSNAEPRHVFSAPLTRKALILVAAANSVNPGENHFRATRHVWGPDITTQELILPAEEYGFINDAGLTVAGAVEASGGFTVGGVPVVAMTEMDAVRAEIDRLSARLAALEGGGGGTTPPATPAPLGPAPAPQAAPAARPAAPVRRPPPRR